MSVDSLSRKPKLAFHQLPSLEEQLKHKKGGILSEIVQKRKPDLVVYQPFTYPKKKQKSQDPERGGTDTTKHRAEKDRWRQRWLSGSAKQAVSGGPAMDSALGEDTELPADYFT